MSDQNTTTTTTTQGTQANTQATPADTTTQRKLYATKEEALKAKTDDTPKTAKPFKVSVNGTVRGWILAVNHDLAICYVARQDGYTASSGVKTAPVTREGMAAALASMSADERMEFLKAYLPAPTTTTTPAPTTTTPTRGRGKN